MERASRGGRDGGGPVALGVSGASAVAGRLEAGSVGGIVWRRGGRAFARRETEGDANSLQCWSYAARGGSPWGAAYDLHCRLFSAGGIGGLRGGRWVVRPRPLGRCRGVGAYLVVRRDGQPILPHWSLRPEVGCALHSLFPHLLFPGLNHGRWHHGLDFTTIITRLSFSGHLPQGRVSVC